MPLTKTLELLDSELGRLLKTNTINDEQLKHFLLEPKKYFSRSKGLNYIDPDAEMTDTHHTQWDMMRDFVQALATEMTSEKFHDLTGRCLTLAPNEGPNTVMRNQTFEKALLAYQMATDEKKAEEHFSKPYITDNFSANGIVELKEVLLKPLIMHFQSPLKKKEELAAEKPLQGVSLEVKKNAEKKSDSILKKFSSSVKLPSLFGSISSPRNSKQEEPEIFIKIDSGL